MLSQQLCTLRPAAGATPCYSDARAEGVGGIVEVMRLPRSSSTLTQNLHACISRLCTGLYYALHHALRPQKDISSRLWAGPEAHVCTVDCTSPRPPKRTHTLPHTVSHTHTHRSSVESCMLGQKLMCGAVASSCMRCYAARCHLTTRTSPTCSRRSRCVLDTGACWQLAQNTHMNRTCSTH